MRAAVLETYNSPLRLRDLPDPEPGPGQVVVDVEACGVCGSDGFLQAGGFDSTLPIVPGHEAAGTVRSVGPDVEGLRPGMQAALYYIQHCGACFPCQRGRVNLCFHLRRMGVDVDGAFATQVTVPANCVLPVSTPIEPAVLAVLTDAVGTSYHALTRVAAVQPGEKVVVFGVGGIGSNAVQLAVHLGASVLAVSRQDAKLELARYLGAEATSTSSTSTARDIFEWAGPSGPDVVIQTVGSEVLDRSALDVVGPGGRVVLVGVSQRQFELRATDLIWREAQLLGSRGFTPEDIRAVIDLYNRGAIRAEHLVTQRRPLTEANEALRDLAEGKVLRTVIEPQR